jgi:cytochrome c peroxidase
MDGRARQRSGANGFLGHRRAAGRLEISPLRTVILLVAWGDADDTGRPPYQWQLPPGFPPPLVPADNPMSDAKVALGKRLFYETRLSSTGTYACASCHRAELAFTDGRAHAVGATGEPVRRAAMSLANVAYSPSFTWGDPRVHTLEAQMRTPLFNRHPLEMGASVDGGAALAAISQDGGYRQQFAAAFPDAANPLSMDNVIKAIAAFERTLISGRSAFDRYVFSDESTAMTEPAKRGMALFFSARIGCSQCHAGINFSGAVIYQGHTQERAVFANNGLYNLHARGDYPQSDQGLTEVTHRGADMGKFRVPTLRNVALTAPYMHDGSLGTLEQVLDHYANGGRHSPRQDARVRPLSLSAAERAEVLEFLHSLTDRDFVDDPRFRP